MSATGNAKVASCGFTLTLSRRRAPQPNPIGVRLQKVTQTVGRRIAGQPSVRRLTVALHWLGVFHPLSELEQSPFFVLSLSLSLLYTHCLPLALAPCRLFTVACLTVFLKPKPSFEKPCGFPDQAQMLGHFASTPSFSWQALVYLAASLALSSAPSLVQAGPSLDLSDRDALQAAAEASIQNLVAMYDNAEDGAFNQIDLPWWACKGASFS